MTVSGTLNVSGGINGIDLEGLSTGKAPTNHASAANTYGLGTNANYGHVKIADKSCYDSESGILDADGLVPPISAIQAVYRRTHNFGTLKTVSPNSLFLDNNYSVFAGKNSGSVVPSFPTGNTNYGNVWAYDLAVYTNLSFPEGCNNRGVIAGIKAGTGAVAAYNAQAAINALYLDENTESDVYGTGNAVAGTILGSGAINATGNGCSIFGYAQDNAALQTEGWGNVAIGAAAAGGAVEARGKGTFAAGQAAGGLLRTDAAANGAIAMGYALDNSLIASGNGSVAIGMADASAPLTASGEASISIGRGINNTIANCMVVGHYPRMAAMTAPTLTANNSTSTETVFAVGCGSKTNPINGLRVTQYGSIIALRSYSTSGADYAELFEWEDGNISEEDRVGKLVTLSEDKIKLAEEVDWILGIVSPAPAVLGNIEADIWHGMYQKDVYGREIYENGSPVLSSEYNSDQTYVSRMDRMEWSAVGLVGQLVCDDDGTCLPNNWMSAAGGIATLSEVQTNIRCMRRIDGTHVLAFIR